MLEYIGVNSVSEMQVSRKGVWSVDIIQNSLLREYCWDLMLPDYKIYAIVDGLYLMWPHCAVHNVMYCANYVKHFDMYILP
jgi:hypothetical protein